MRFGVFYEQQLPTPVDATATRSGCFAEALEQVALADRLGFDNAWVVEHHFLEEYSHSSAPEVFLAAAAARTERIRLGHGIRHAPPALQPAGAHGRGRVDARPDLARADRVRHRRGGDPARARRLRHPGQGEAGDEPRGRRADRQHDGDVAVPRLRGDVASRSRAATSSPSRSRSRTRRCGSPARTATRSRSPPAPASARWRSRFVDPDEAAHVGRDVLRPHPQ